MTQSSALVQLSSVVHSVRYEDLPRAVVDHAKALILDTLGCAFGGFSANVSKAVRTMASELGGERQSTILGTNERTSMPLATLANGTMLRYLDSNDYYFSRDPAHPSGNLAVALAVGEKMQCSGKELIAALTAAYEVHLRFCDFAGAPTLWRRGWHHGTNAQFSSSALAARLLRNDPTVTAHAMAISASHHNTLAQLQSGEISEIKATAEAWVAKGGVEAALLAAQNVTGPLSLLEGKAGWADTVGGAVDIPQLVAPVNGHYRLLQVSIKPYPAVATATAPIRAAIDLHPECQGRFDQIDKIIVRLPAFALGTPSADPGRRFPTTRESADHSFYYCVAIALLEGVCGEAQFDKNKLTLPTLRDLLAHVELVEDAEYSALWPQTAGGAVQVQMRDGTTLESRYEYPPGHPRNPLDRAALMEKFHEHADPILTCTGADNLRTIVESLDDCTDLRALCRALGPTNVHQQSFRHQETS